MRSMVQHQRRGVYPCRLTGPNVTMHLPPRRMRRAFGFFSSILLAPAGEPDGGGGAGGSGDGSGNPGGGGQPVGLAEGAIAQVNELINKALGPRFKAFEDKLVKTTEASVGKLFETFGASLDEKLAALKPADDGKPNKKPDANDLSQNPEFRAQKKQLDDLKSELQKERDEKAKARAAARDAALYQRVEAELQALNLTDVSSLRKLLHADKVVGYEDDDSDTVVFRDEEGGALPLKKGLESWVKSSPLAQRFKPATGADGSGEHGGGVKRPATSETPRPTKTQLGQAIVRLAQNG